MKKIKAQKFISLTLKALIIFGLFAIMPFTVNAAGETCSIGSTSYATLDDALAAVPTGGTTPTTIKLLANIDYNKQLTIGNKKITFDLNGYTLNAGDPNNSVRGLYVTGGGEVSLTKPINGELNAAGYSYGVNVASSGKAEVTSAKSDMIAVYAYDGEVTVYGDATYSSNASSTYIGANVLGSGKITVEGTINTL